MNATPLSRDNDKVKRLNGVIERRLTMTKHEDSLTTRLWRRALMLALCVTGVTGHWLLIKCYDVAEASAIQPFAYFQMVFAGAVGIIVFGDMLRSNTLIGSAIVVGAGLFALLRARRVASSVDASSNN